MKKSDNILVAEFLGFEKVETWYEDKTMLLPDHIYVYGNSFDEDELMFNISWDWLVPVVRVCFEDGAEGEEIGDITHGYLDCNLEATYKAVVEYIKNK